MYAIPGAEVSSPYCRVISVSSAAMSWPRCGRSSGFGASMRATSHASCSGTDTISSSGRYWPARIFFTISFGDVPENGM
jgi:hypothetical protein